MDDVISSYSWQQGVDDGYLAKVFENRWDELSKGKPILATQGVITECSLAALMELWNEWVQFKKKYENETMYTGKVNDKVVWLMDDGVVFTFLYPDEY